MADRNRWSATFCFTNIALAISAAVLITHASVLKNANHFCLLPLVDHKKCSGIIPDCRLEKSLSIAEGFLFAYTLTIGFSSLFWLVCLMCKRGSIQYEERPVNYFAHVIFHAIGCIFSFASSVAVAVFLTHAALLIPTDDFEQKIVNNYVAHGQHFRSFNPMNTCIQFFGHGNYVWNIVGLVFLLISFVCHAVLIAFIDTIWVRESMWSYMMKCAATIPGYPQVASQEGNDEKAPQNERVRIPSTRKYPSSPILLNPLALDNPTENKKSLAP